MSKTNAAIKIAPQTQTDEELAKSLREMRDMRTALEDSIKFYTALLLERANQRNVDEFEAGSFCVKIVRNKTRTNFSIKGASESLSPELFIKYITPFLSESSWDEVRVVES